MKKRKSLWVLLLGLCMMFVMTVQVRAQGAAPVDSTAVQKAITMVAGEIRPVPDMIDRYSVNSSDEEIVSLNENREMVAEAPGTATITKFTFTGYVEYKVTVTDTVDIIVAAGQSNMNGSGGDEQASPVPREGTLRWENGELRPMTQESSLLPAFANEYRKATGVPVITIQTAVGGSTSHGWLAYGYAKKSANALKSCKKHLKKHQVKVRHIYMLWYQGESDARKGEAKAVYMSHMKKIYKKLKAAGVEKCMIIQVGEYKNRAHDAGAIAAAQKTLCKKEKKKFVMVSTLPRSLSNKEKWYADNVHFNQKALNKIGKDAGKKAAKIAGK